MQGQRLGQRLDHGKVVVRKSEFPTLGSLLADHWGGNGGKGWSSALKIRDDTAQTVAYSRNYRLSRQLQTVKTCLYSKMVSYLCFGWRYKHGMVMVKDIADLTRPCWATILSKLTHLLSFILEFIKFTNSFLPALVHFLVLLGKYLELYFSAKIGRIIFGVCFSNRRFNYRPV